MDPWGSEVLDSTVVIEKFEDNFKPTPEPEKLADSAEYLAVLERKLQAIRKKNKVVENLSAYRADCLDRLLREGCDLDPVIGDTESDKLIEKDPQTDYNNLLAKTFFIKRDGTVWDGDVLTKCRDVWAYSVDCARTPEWLRKDAMTAARKSLFIFLMGLAWKWRYSMPLALSGVVAILGHAWMFQIRVHTVHRVHDNELTYYEDEEEQEDDTVTWDTESTDSWETIVEEVAYG